MKTLSLIICLIIASIRGYASESMDGDTAFSVGDISISQYIYNREINKAFRKRTPSNLEKEKWMRDWIGRLRVAGHAIEKGYRNNTDVKHAVKILSRHMLLKGEDGPFYKEIVDSEIVRSGVSIGGLNRKELYTMRQSVLEKLSSGVIEESEIITSRKASQAIVQLYRDLTDKHNLSPDILVGQCEDLELFNYAKRGHRVSISTHQFIKSYGNKVYKRYITKEADLDIEIKEYIVDEAFYSMIIEKNLDQEKHFVWEKDNFEYNTIYNVFKMNEFLNKVTVSDSSCLEHYKANQNSFAIPSTICAFEILFDDMDAAQKSRRVIQISIRENGLKSLEQFISTAGFSYSKETIKTDSTKLNSNLVNRLAQSPPGWTSNVMPKGKLSSFWVKESHEGQSFLPFEIVKETIMKRLADEIATAQISKFSDGLSDTFSFIESTPY
ncbi:hypothetical protein MLD52_03610 [Puniceicoccaceae bacterium K14]|nr:hypothetical protein [Puniceicoccaceae bacterium K14]